MQIDFNKYKEKATNLLNSILDILDDKEWQTQSDTDDITLHTRKYKDSNIFTVKATGLINSKPNILCDYLWTMKKDLVKYHDPAMKEFNIIYYSDDIKIMRQVSKIIYPIKDREVVYFVYKIYKYNEIWLVNFSIPHDAYPENPELYVRATLDYSIVGFVPNEKGDKTTVYTIIHLDPNGSIPSMIVNSYYWKVAYYIKYWKDFYKS